MNAVIEKYAERHKYAARQLVKATARVYPVGTIVSATLGRSRIRGPVLRSGGHWWCDPDAICIRNEKTGKQRKVNVTSAHANVVIEGRAQ